MSDEQVRNANIAVSLLDGHARNYRQHPPEQIKQLVASLQRFQQVRSIVVKKQPHCDRYTILAGHGLVEAARECYYPELRCDIVPDSWDDLTCQAYLIADNNLSNNAIDDESLLAELLTEQQNAGYNLASLGTDDETLRQMLEALGDEMLAGDGESAEEDYEEDLSLSDQDTAIYPNEVILSESVRYFRNRGFPYRAMPLYMCMQEINKLANVDEERLLHSNLGYHVADTYHPHRMHASAEKMKSPLEAFTQNDLLLRALKLYQEQTGAVPLDILGKLAIVSGTQACSNFRPGFALYLYRKYCTSDSVVLDTSTGYGGRLIGFIASGLAGKYIGIDPNTVTHAANERMASDLYFTEKVELYNLAAEDVPHEKVAGRCDFAFTSPPYFAKEHYSDEDTQSWKRYNTGEAWRVGFLQKMLALQYAALKPGCYSIVNIADVKLRGKTYPLTQWTIDDGKACGFEYIETLQFDLTHRFGAGQEDEVSTEPVIVFRKPLERVEEVAHART